MVAVIPVGLAKGDVVGAGKDQALDILNPPAPPPPAPLP